MAKVYASLNDPTRARSLGSAQQKFDHGGIAGMQSLRRNAAGIIGLPPSMILTACEHMMIVRNLG